MNMNFLNNLTVALFRYPWIKKRWAKHFNALKSDTIPWTPLRKPISKCKIALITTGGVHLKDDKPFDMEDKNGDPTYRKIPSTVSQNNLIITHKYYNHRDADRDINLVFPFEILKNIQHEGFVGESAEYFFSFMGHIINRHIKTLVEQTSKDVAKQLKQEQVDIALLVPA